MAERPLFLVVNDDGVHAPGIAALRQVASEFGDVVVIAPLSEKSGAGQSLTLTLPLRLQQIDDSVYALSGTPTDCVMFAVHEHLPRRPDWVFSGINRGSNLGQDTLYSGTVAAAMEAIIQGVPSMAFSLKGAQHFTVKDFSHAAKVAGHFIERRNDFLGPAQQTVINVNIPDIPFASMRGIRTAGIGRRIYDSRFYKNTDPRGYEYYWLGGGGDQFEDIPNSDCLQVEEGYVAVSFLKPDHNDYDLMSKWTDAKLEALDSGFVSKSNGGA